ncbi:MAG: YjjI family glycine radical enzyme [Kineosporiaceae bacterium]
MAEFEVLVRRCVADPTLTYRQRVQQLAMLAENAVEPPPVSQACVLAQAKGVIHDMGEGNAPYRPRYVLPDYAAALATGSAHLELAAPTDLDGALTFLLAMYAGVPSITGYPVYLGDLDRLLEPFVGDLADEDLDARLTRFWQLIDRTMPDAFVHANLGPDDGRVVRSLLRVDRATRQVVPNLTLRVDPDRTPDALLREAVATTCADGKPHYVNDPMMRADLGEAYGVVSCYNSLPRGGGAHTLVRLDLSASVRQAAVGPQSWLDAVLPVHVALTAELMAARIRHLVEQSRFFEHDWLAREGLIRLEGFTAMFGFYGLAEAVEALGAGRYGLDPEATALGQRIVERLAGLVAATPMPYCEATGGHALLHAQSGIDSDTGVTAGARIPVGCEPPLYAHIRAVAPNHRHVPAGISDVFRFEPTIEANPDAVVAVLRGAFAEGMRDVTFDVVGNGFIRITGFLVRERDVAAVATGARHASTVLGAAAIPNHHLADRVVKPVGDPTSGWAVS